MVVSEPLYYLAQAGVLLAIAAIAVSLVFLVLRTRRRPRYGAAIGLLALAAGGLLIALASDSVACWAESGGNCTASGSYSLKVALLWSVAIALWTSLARAPWRRHRKAG